MGKLILVRHGESQYNAENRFTGWDDPSLTDRGLLEMMEVGHEIRGVALDIAFCSALRRTAESVRAVLGAAHQPELPIEAASELNERSYGDLQGLNKTDAIGRFGADQVGRWRRSFHAVPPGGESMEQASERISAFFQRRILPEAKRWNVLVCAHGNTLRAIVRKLDSLGDEAFERLEIPTGSIFAYLVNEDGAIEAVSRRMPGDTNPGGSIV